MSSTKYFSNIFASYDNGSLICYDRTVNTIIFFMKKQSEFLIIFDDHLMKSQLTVFSILLFVSQATNSFPDCCADPCRMYTSKQSSICMFWQILLITKSNSIHFLRN